MDNFTKLNSGDCVDYDESLFFINSNLSLLSDMIKLNTTFFRISELAFDIFYIIEEFITIIAN